MPTTVSVYNRILKKNLQHAVLIDIIILILLLLFLIRDYVIFFPFCCILYSLYCILPEYVYIFPIEFFPIICLKEVSCLFIYMEHD